MSHTPVMTTRWRWILVWALSICIALPSLYAIAVRWTNPLPINPWEPAIAMEAVRLNAGLPVYDSSHATHIYGPLLTVALAGIFRVSGLNLLAARVTMSILAFTLPIFVSAILCRDRLRPWLVLSVLLFVGLNFRTDLVFLSVQPDCVAALLAIVALYFWISRNVVIAVAFFIVSMLLKQTAAAFAVIPLVYELIWRRPISIPELLRSLVPPISVLVTIGAIHWISPELYHAMITVPASIKVYPERLPAVVFYLFATFPVFVVGLFALFSKKRPMDERERWIVAALVVLIPSSIWTICKSGGSYNSLLFAYLAMTALFIARLDIISEWLASQSTQKAATAVTVIVLAVPFSIFVQFDRAAALVFAQHGDDKYAAAVTAARNLGAISPQDPTIAYRATGYIGRSLFFELDTHAENGNWPKNLPESLLHEIGGANYVVTVRSYVPTPVFERGLLASNFHPIVVKELEGSAYTVWTTTHQ